MLQATPPTMPAFFKNSRRESDERVTADALDFWVWASADADSAARFAQRSSHRDMSYPREIGLPTPQD
jgi:hypothetical protein